MDAADPLLAADSPTRLLRWTLGPAPAASPSKAHEELLHAISRPLKGSKELIEQARMVMKEHGDIRMLYQDDGAKAMAPTNDKKDQQGRRPGLNRKRARFVPKGPASKPVPVVDRSKLSKITNPVEYFKALDDIEEAEKEIKRLTGEVVPEKIYNFGPVEEPKRRPGLPGRKLVHKFKITACDYTQDPIEGPASQKGPMTESQLSQDDAHALVSEENEQTVPSRSGEHAISDVSMKEDSVPEKNDGDDLTYLLTSLQNLDEPEEEEFFRKTLGIKEIRMEKVCLRDSIPGDRSLRSNTVRKSPMRVCAPERPLPGSLKARILELEERFIIGDAAKDKCTDLLKDDEFEGSPDVVVGERSLVHDYSDALMTEETSIAKEIDRETRNLSVKTAEHVLDPKPNMPDCVVERQEGGSPLVWYSNTEVGNEKAACSRHNISMGEDDVLNDYPTIDFSNNETEVSSSHQLEGSLTEVLVSTPGRNVSPDGIAGTSHAAEDNVQHLEDDVPTDHPTIDMSNNETEVSSSHQLEGSLTEVLVSTPGRNVAPDGIARTSHAAEDNFQHLEAVEEDGVLKDKSSHPLEMPLEDIDPQNQSQMHVGNIKKLVADLTNALSPINEKKQQAVKKGQNNQPSKRGQKVSDEPSHPPEIPEANFDSEHQPHVDNVDNERQTVGMSNAQSPNKAKGQKGAQRRNKSEKLNRRKSLADAGLAWQSGVRRSTRIRSRPLEHWLGERFIYGRIHDTMATVIGIKAYSPGQDGKKALKVKSFVSEQYSDLVAEAAKY